MVDHEEKAPAAGWHLPFYIVAPAYDEASAGNRVLYQLAARLISAGYESYIVSRDQLSSPLPILIGNHAIDRLTPRVAAKHFQEGRLPIVVYPEVAQTLSPAGFRVLYLLNHLGEMGGPARLPDCEYVLAYSETIARHVPECDSVLFLPVSDPTYWVPLGQPRPKLASVYAGKFVDHYGNRLPDDMQGLFVITRHHAAAPTRNQIRTILQHSSKLYVFEDTAIATEALLCGCPVIVMKNIHFVDRIGETELGSLGVAISDREADLEKARSELDDFRSTYLHTLNRMPDLVSSFAAEVQKRAAERDYPQPFVFA